MKELEGVEMEENGLVQITVNVTKKQRELLDNIKREKHLSHSVQVREALNKLYINQE